MKAIPKVPVVVVVVVTTLAAAIDRPYVSSTIPAELSSVVTNSVRASGHSASLVIFVITVVIIVLFGLVFCLCKVRLLVHNWFE